MSKRSYRWLLRFIRIPLNVIDWQTPPGENLRRICIERRVGYLEETRLSVLQNN